MQKVEAAALTYLQRARDDLGGETGLITPKLLYEDHENHVLVLEDLGSDLVSIDSWLAMSPCESIIPSVGDRLWTFLAKLHSIGAAVFLWGFPNNERFQNSKI